MPVNWENSAVATGLEKVSFISIPKKGNAKECSNYRTIAQISGGSEVKASAYNAGDLGSIPQLGRNGNPLQYSCSENPMDGGAWWATVHWVTKSRTQLSNFTFTRK